MAGNRRAAKNLAIPEIPVKHPTHHPVPCRPKSLGFTLVELMVAIVIVAVLASVAMAVARSAILRSKEVSCLNNMKNIGIALHLYSIDHGGRYPETTHTIDLDRAWISSLEEYLDDYDAMRVCPADPRREGRIEAGGTSYVLNSFIFVPEIGPWGEPIGPALNRPAAIPDASRTMLAFICSDKTGVGPGNDHTHSNQWNSWAALCSDIAPGRFGGDPDNPRAVEGRSNYLYADGSVRSLRASELKNKIDSGINPATVPGLE